MAVSVLNVGLLSMMDRNPVTGVGVSVVMEGEMPLFRSLSTRIGNWNGT